MCRNGLHNMDITGRAKDGRCLLCKREKDRRYSHRNAARLYQKNLKWRKANPERYREAQNRYARKAYAQGKTFNQQPANHLRKMIHSRRYMHKVLERKLERKFNDITESAR